MIPRRKRAATKDGHSSGNEPIQLTLAVLNQGPFDSQCFELVDEESSKLLAAFVHPEFKSLSKIGQLEIHRTYGEDFETLAILSGLAVFERSGRRERRDPALLLVEAGKRVLGSALWKLTK